MKYLQSFVPPGKSGKQIIRTKWSGINRLGCADTGQLSDATNISMAALPSLIPSEAMGVYSPFPGHLVVSDLPGAPDIVPVSLFFAGSDIIEIYRIDSFLYIDYFNSATYSSKTATLKAGANQSDDYPRSLVQFTEYSPSGETKKLLLFPDKVAFDYRPDTFTLTSLGAAVPDIDYAVVYQSRLFGVCGDRIYVSGEGDYTNWTYDTGEVSEPSNAWSAAVQANGTSAGGYTGVTVYDGSVICLRSEGAQQIFNTKNPYRIADIGTFGSLSDRSFAHVNGKLYTVGRNDVTEYDGGVPEYIGDVLNISDYTGAVCGGFKDTFCMYLSGKVYTFNTKNRQWGCIAARSPVVMFTSNGHALLAYCEDGQIWKMNTNAHLGQHLSFDTDIITLGAPQLRRIRRVCASVELEEGSSVIVNLVDSSGGEHIVAQTEESGAQTIGGVVRMSGGSWHKIRFSGVGMARIHQMSVDVDFAG